MAKKKVVVVGRAGTLKFSLPASEYEVTIIDARGHYEYTPGILRLFVEPEASKNIVVPHPPGVVIDAVVAIHVSEDRLTGEVVLASGTRLSYDYLVLATGSSYSPFKGDSLVKKTAQQGIGEFAEEAKRLAGAGTVVVAGGGVTGVELAAEIVATYGASKRVTLVSATSSLLPTLHPDCGKYAEKWLRDRGVSLLMSTRVLNVDWAKVSVGTGPHALQLSTGGALEADVVYKCMGLHLNDELRSKVYLPDGSALDLGGTPGRGFPVLPTLQVTGLPTVFAVGDVADTPFDKTLVVAGFMTKVVQHNIKQLGKGKEPGRFPECVLYGSKVAPEVFNVSLSKNDGVMQMNTMVMSGGVPAFMKGMIQSLLVGIATGHWFSILIGKFMDWNMALQLGYMPKRPGCPTFDNPTSRPGQLDKKAA